MRRQFGFTYLGVLILVAIIGAASAATVSVGALMQRRAAEEELLAIGREFRSAFTSYYYAANGPVKYPRELTELLKDPRFPNTRRHLRRIYPDPLTGKEAWGTIPAPGGGIMGVYSLAEGAPIKTALFPAELPNLNGAKRYSDWTFSFEPPMLPSR